MSEVLRAQEIAERALEASTADGCVVLVDESTSANLRWANNTLTTNGVIGERRVTVICTVEGAAGTAAGVSSRSTVDADSIVDLVAAAEAAARDSEPADDAQPLVEGDTDADWDDEPGGTSIRVFADVAPALGEAFARARAEERALYGYAEHDVTTTYLASSTGLRRRHVQPQGKIEITGKSADLSRSTWVGQGTTDFADVDLASLDAQITQRLDWSRRSVPQPAGRYETVLPPTAVADLMIYLYWSAAARDAREGRTVFSRSAGRTRVGDRLSARRLTLSSDPAAEGLECAPFFAARSSSSESSVFDNGLALQRTSWVQDGELAALVQTRHSGRLTALPVTPPIGNLTLSDADADGGLEDLIARTERGLLLNCLWYIREVDPQTLLLTGLTRDGVYLVEGGEVVGAVNNFRFNESPVALLDRITDVGRTERTLPREWSDWFTRASMPAIRVPDFNMSTVSEAS